MKKIEEIINTPESVIETHNTVFALYLLYGLFVSIFIGTNINYWLSYFGPFIFMLYFYYINTTNGKKNFDKINNIVSIICFISLLVTGLYFLIHFLEVNSLYTLIKIISYALNMFFPLYWIAVFYTNKEQNKKIFLTEKSNQNYYHVIVISCIGINILEYLAVLIENGTVDYLMLNIISSIIFVLLYILRVRYVYLYQEHVSKRRDDYV